MQRLHSVLGNHIYNDETLGFQFLVRLFGVVLAISMMQLSQERTSIFIYGPITFFFVIYCFFVRFSKLRQNILFQKINLYVDVLIISIFVAIRGGLRSDFYLGYYIILGYILLLRDHKLIMHINLWIIASYIIVSFVFSEPMDINRLLIRLALMGSTMYVFFNYSKILSKETTLRLKASTLALKDSLTGVYNRNILESLNALIEDKTIIVALIDIDNFKFINDTYGHIYGDQVLTYLGELLNQHMDQNDIAIRYGGEEFLLILELNVSEATHLLNKIRQGFASKTYEWHDGSITLSGGLTVHHSNQSLNEAIDDADKQLYKAKSSGKNKVMFS